MKTFFKNLLGLYNAASCVESFKITAKFAISFERIFETFLKPFSH